MVYFFWTLVGNLCINFTVEWLSMPRGPCCRGGSIVEFRFATDGCTFGNSGPGHNHCTSRRSSLVWVSGGGVRVDKVEHSKRPNNFDNSKYLAIKHLLKVNTKSIIHSPFYLIFTCFWQFNLWQTLFDN